MFLCPPSSFKVDQSDEIKILKDPKLAENIKQKEKLYVSFCLLSSVAICHPFPLITCSGT